MRISSSTSAQAVPKTLASQIPPVVGNWHASRLVRLTSVIITTHQLQHKYALWRVSTQILFMLHKQANLIRDYYKIQCHSKISRNPWFDSQQTISGLIYILDTKMWQTIARRICIIWAHPKNLSSKVQFSVFTQFYVFQFSFIFFSDEGWGGGGASSQLT